MDQAPLRMQPGERVVWEGRPVRSLIFRPHDGVLVAFSIVWAGFATVPVMLAVSALLNSPPALLFIGPIALLFGWTAGYTLVARFLVRARTCRNVSYMVTDRRIVIVRGRLGQWSTSTYLTSGGPSPGETVWLWVHGGRVSPDGATVFASIYAIAGLGPGLILLAGVLWVDRARRIRRSTVRTEGPMTYRR